MSSSPLLDKEATAYYYYGLPSRPRLVARTSVTPWEKPSAIDYTFDVPMELRPVGMHAIAEVWEDNLALKIQTLLDEMRVEWTSIDVVRIGWTESSISTHLFPNTEPLDSAPVVLWIGVMPSSLSGADGVTVAFKCKELLEQYRITDVDVEIRESIVSSSSGAGPKLLEPSDDCFDSTADVCEPLTTTLGLPISAQSAPSTIGTGGFFITEGGKPDTLLLVTTRHVIFGPDQNQRFENESDSDDLNRHRHNVTLFNDVAFNKYLDSIQTEIRLRGFTAEYNEDRVAHVEGKDDSNANKVREAAQKELAGARKAAEKFKALYETVKTEWSAPESRILGHVVLSPPIDVGNGSEAYLEDWAIIEIDPSKIDNNNFKGNAIDLGTRIPMHDLNRMMNPNIDYYYFRDYDALPFRYPFERLLELQGTIPDDELRHPPRSSITRERNGGKDPDPQCIMVLKRGHGTDLTVGRANTIFSYVRRDYLNDTNGSTTTKISKEWPILPRDIHTRAFSGTGDSGAVVVDGRGRIGGILTGGAGTMKRFSPKSELKLQLDISYATPISFLLKSMQAHGLREPNIGPVLNV